mmetsp:Transcript_120916/g.240885  ORF Transcript_120916/g.240885 Transcript_120916/m.240885 type:complete len:207 (+) Transcript_120916:585-1205(+)
MCTDSQRSRESGKRLRSILSPQRQQPLNRFLWWYSRRGNLHLCSRIWIRAAGFCYAWNFSSGGLNNWRGCPCLVHPFPGAARHHKKCGRWLTKKLAQATVQRFVCSKSWRPHMGRKPATLHVSCEIWRQHLIGASPRLDSQSWTSLLKGLKRSYLLRVTMQHPAGDNVVATGKWICAGRQTRNGPQQLQNLWLHRLPPHLCSRHRP